MRPKSDPPQASGHTRFYDADELDRLLEQAVGLMAQFGLASGQMRRVLGSKLDRLIRQHDRDLH